jgi:glycosyltransferase involved in cell wall biosynthesis
MSVRVLHVISSLKGYGAERQVLDLLPHLKNEQVTVAALAVYSSKLSADERASLNCPAIDVGRRSRKDYTFILRLIQEIKRYKPDIVHTHTHVGKYWGGLAAKAAGVPKVVHTEHNPCDPRRNLLERAADRVLHPLTDRVITFLYEQRPALARIDGIDVDKIRIIPNGLATQEKADSPSRATGRLLLGVADDELAVITVGRLEFQKNQRLALLAVKEVEPSLRRRIRLFFAGGGSQEAVLRSLARTLELDDNVTFLGHRKDVDALLAGSDLLFMTSLFEGMPLVLIEAMLAGTPILSTPWTGARGMLGEGRFGFLSSGFEPREIANALGRALSSKDYRESMALRAREHARSELDIRRMADAYRNLYLELAPSA